MGNGMLGHIADTTSDFVLFSQQLWKFAGFTPIGA
jgi:hypothetical protein